MHLGGTVDLLRHFVYENPTTVLVALIIATVVLGTIWRRTGSAGCRWAALACVTVGLLVTLLAYVVETDRERLQATLRTMAEAIDAGRPDPVIACISPEYRSDSLDKEGLADIVRRGLKYVRAAAEAPRIVMRDREALVTQASRFRPAPGSQVVLPHPYQRIVWEAVFAPDTDGEWRLRSAKVIHPRDMLPQEAARHLPGR